MLGDLSSRRGRILGIDSDGHFQVIRATVPYKQLDHYSTTIRSLTSGRGRYAENFSHYEEVPARPGRGDPRRGQGAQGGRWRRRSDGREGRP